MVILAGAADRKSPPVETFRQGLRDLGYVEGKNIQVEFRYTEGTTNPVPTLVAELVQLKPDVLVIGQGQTAIRAAKQATKTIPIVVITTVDPVAAELVDSLAHPGGNLTGLTSVARELSGKRLELLKEVVPTTSRVGFLLEADSPGAAVRFTEYHAAARPLKIEVHARRRHSGGGFTHRYPFTDGGSARRRSAHGALSQEHERRIAAFRHRSLEIFVGHCRLAPSGRGYAPRKNTDSAG